MVGVTYQYMQTNVDISDLLPAGQERGLFSYTTVASARSGTLARPASKGYVYVTRQPFTREQVSVALPDGSTFDDENAVTEVVDGVKQHPCAILGAMHLTAPATVPGNVVCYSLATPAVAEPQWQTNGGSPAVTLGVLYPLLIAAIDPTEESKLVGLDSAVVAGRALAASDSWAHGVQSGGSYMGAGASPPLAPAILALGQAADYTSTATISSLSAATAERFVRLSSASDAASFAPDPVGSSVVRSRTGADLYADGLAAVKPSDTWAEPFAAGGVKGAVASMRVMGLFQPGPVSYSAGTPLRPVAVEASDPDVGEFAPVTGQDTWFRRLDHKTAGVLEHSLDDCPAHPDQCFGGFGLQVVGRFDASKVREGAALGKVPLETYAATPLLAADDATRTVLGGDTMLSDLNAAGYAQLPPSLLMPIKALPMLAATGSDALAADPVSAVRVRVAGVTGPDAVSRERVRVVAERIRAATGLDVDIIVGSSPLPQQVELPASKLGVPALSLNELWTKKGVALTILDALDVKSLALFWLILASSAVTVAVIARASVAARRRELGVLRASGWRTSQLIGALLVEAGLIGLAAGTVGALASWPLTLLLGVAFDPARAALAVPTAVGLAVLASLAAAVSAGRLTPVEALAPQVAGGRRPLLRVRGPISLGLLSVLRRPGRLLAGALTVALGVGSLLFLAAVSRLFSGAVVGTLLGDAVAVQVRAPDMIAATVLAALGLIAVGVILFLGLTEDLQSYAVLTAAGWSHGTLGSAILTQAAVIALVGSVLGLGLAASGVGYLTGGLPPGLLAYGAAATAAAIAASGLVALAPALAFRRLPLTRLLAGE
jgi:putative ABC transport system permease protein